MNLHNVRRAHRIGARPLPAILTSLALSLVLSSGAAQAITFGVQVVDARGEAVPGASVCIGLPGNYRQFGALFTDGQGRVSTDVPNVPLVVTVSKTRFAAIRMREPARSFNLIKQVVLDEGAEPGPRCRADSSLAGSGMRLSIDGMSVDRAAAGTRVSLTVSGMPTHYRLSRDEDLLEAEWQPYAASIVLPADMSRGDEVFVQLRRYEGSERSWLETRSPITPVLLATFQ